jgi:hypothetical protein
VLFGCDQTVHHQRRKTGCVKNQLVVDLFFTYVPAEPYLLLQQRTSTTTNFF